MSKRVVIFLNATIAFVGALVGAAVALVLTALVYLAIGELTVYSRWAIPDPTKTAAVIVYVVYVIALAAFIHRFQGKASRDHMRG